MRKTKIKNYIMIPEYLLQLDLTPRACLLYGIIYKISSGELNETFASPRYFAKILKVEERTIKNLIKELEEKKCISTRTDETNKYIKYIKTLIIKEVIYIEETPKGKIETPKALKDFMENIK